jgi:NAD-reducing hydrogenase large subunit
MSPIRYTGNPINEEGVGVIEAPRGVLVHNYGVDKFGKMVKANLIVATGHNNIAINRSVELVAKEYIHQGKVEEGMLNRVEGAIRCYDPCLSCATHAVGKMPLIVGIYDATGELVDEIRRD